MRTIDADALIKVIEDDLNHHYVKTDYDFGYDSGLSHAVYHIDNASTVELTEEQAIDKLHETGWMQNHDREMTEQPTGEWISVKYRPLTVDERIRFADHYGIEYSDTIDEKAFDCPLPHDGQEILVSTSWGVCTDVADHDTDGEGFTTYGLEGNGDWDGIDAWMPLPKPYVKGGEVGE